MRRGDHADLAALAGYWLGELDPATQAAVDEHLLACDRCGRLFDEVVALAGGIREAFARGRLHAFVTADFVRRLDERGGRVREYRLAPGGSVNCTVLPQDGFVVAQMDAPLEGVARLDAIVEAAGEAQSFHDVPFDAARGAVVLISRTASLREMPSHRTSIRLVAVEDGPGRELGVYTFNHTRHEG